MTNENTIKSMIAARAEQITGDFIEAEHCSGGSMTESCSNRLGCPDPAGAWNSEAVAVAWDLVKIRESLANELFDDLEELAEAIDRVMCSIAEQQFHAWAGDQSWWGVCPTKSLDDVCMSFDCGPAWDIESFE